ncbi:phosphonate ABC transporter, permease protein PhnE [Pacificispira spongiicola]|nr:phosphonate ABC transporter, permease protein PhnE [Pacificispira spongiicola]
MSTIAHSTDMSISRAEVLKTSRRATIWPIAGLILAFVYLAYAWFAFDVGGVLAKADWERGALMSRDSFHYKYQVELARRNDELSVTVEGGRGTEQDPLPAWITTDGKQTRVDLGDGYRAVMNANALTYTEPDGRQFVAEIKGKEVVVNGYRAFLDETESRYRYFPETAPERTNVVDYADLVALGVLPDGSSFAPSKFEFHPDYYKDVRITRAQIRVQRYFFGWEYFWFGPQSPLVDKSAAEVWGIVWSGDRIDPALSNAEFVFLQFWRNPDWQHNEMFTALLETLLMALLGTFVAAGVGLPLGFLAAANFNPMFASRMVLRRLFDFLRGIDQIIWSLIFIRAFGLGPLTGSLAIAFTDTGTLGKLFSEAIENIDNKQVEGVRSTGAAAVQRYRFGVIPQILPVFVSQTLYYLESNIRSATVIGALGAGGIGLKLVQALQTHKDWENVMYLIFLTLIVVVAMDIGSGWLRRKLIGESTH